MQFSSIWPIDRNLSGATTLGQSGRRCDGNEGVYRIPPSITGTSSSYFLVSYPGHSLAEGAESLNPLQRSSRYILQPLPDWATDTWRRLVSGYGKR